MQLFCGFNHGALEPAWPSGAKLPVGLEADVFVGEDDHIVAEHHQHIGEFLRAALAAPHVLGGVEIGMRPKTQERLAA